MPIDEEPSTKSEPTGPEESTPETPVAAEQEGEHVSLGGSSSRWLDYDTHELLDMISDLEDERRWARLREGIWIAILLHVVLISAATWIPQYVFKVPPVVDPFNAIKERKDLTYLDVPPDALRRLQPKVVVKPVPEKPTVIDKKTLEAMKRETPPPAVEPPATAPTPALAPTPAPPLPQSQQSQTEAPRPAAVPARPNFAMGSQNPGDQLRDAMKGSMRNQGSAGSLPPIRMQQHPNAMPGVSILSDTQGVDFSSWLRRWHYETQRTWDPLIPDEVNPPINKTGVVVIRFRVQPNGRLVEGGMVLEGRSGDVALDRAAWGALTGSNYPALPREFHGPYLELRASFWYGIEPH
jgi:hypothetical protein